ncbi:MAG: hypothetical protein PHY47_24715 [Lachnospiraceae bacterium]|nr:hypothetical protein [Lachnospiraceae bacterium]
MEVAVLTKSSKFGNYCVAGINLASGEFVRLVTEDDTIHGALTFRDIMYEDGSCMQEMDIVKVEIKGRDNNLLQPENVVIDRDYYLDKAGTFSISELVDICPNSIGRTIFGNTGCYVHESDIESVGKSLTLIRVSDFVVHQRINAEGRPKAKASFNYNGYIYDNMPITDPNYYGAENGTEVDDAILVVSIGSPYGDKHYKFVAAVYEI